jgi:hypothetical protein
MSFNRGSAMTKSAHWYRSHEGRVGLALMMLLFVVNTMSIASASDTDDWGAIQLLGEEIAPGTRSKFPVIHDRCRYSLAVAPNQDQRYA